MDGKRLDQWAGKLPEHHPQKYPRNDLALSGVELMSSVVGTKGVYVFKIFLECDMEAGISLPIEVDQTAANTYEVMCVSPVHLAS